MDATLILGPEADEGDRTEWLKTRAGGIGGSDISTILGLNKRKSARQLWEEKTGRREKDHSWNEAAHWGTLLEPTVREEFARRTGMRISKPGTFRSNRHEWQIVNPDGLVYNALGEPIAGYEGKTASLWLEDEWAGDQIPDHAELQAQYCMGTLDLPDWYVAGLIGGQRLVWKRIDRDQKLIDMIEKAVSEFWTYNVTMGVPPKLEGHAAAKEWAEERYRVAHPGKEVVVDSWLAGQLRAAIVDAKTAQKGGKELYEAVQNQLRDLLGDGELLVTGEGAAKKTLATWKNTGSSFDEERCKAEHPDEYAAFVEMVPQFQKKAFAEKHPDLFRQYRNRTLLIKGV